MGKLIVRIASLLLIAAFLPTAVLAAEWNLENGSIEITATANAGGGTTQTVSQGGSSAEDSNPTITSKGKQTGNTITIKAGGGTTANVTIKDTNIRAGGTAIKTEGEGNVNLNVEGINTVSSGDKHAGVEKANDGNLTIGSESGEGELTANGGHGGAGIGGGYEGSGSDITITGGEITANGGGEAAGIGGGVLGSGSDITITGGKVTATGGNGAAGIGGGNYKDGNDINIAGGKVTATGGDYGAGIGGGNQGNGKNITITGGEVTAAGGTNGAGIGGGLRKEGEKITVSGDATLKVQGGLTDEWDGAGAGIGNGGRHNGDTGSFIPVNGAETEPDTSNLTTGKIEYYAPGADMTKDEPTSTILGSGQPASPGETAAPVEYRMQTSASEPVQGNGKSTGYKAPVQGHFYQVVDQDGKDMIFATAQKKDVLAIATDSDFAMLTGKMVDIEALRKQGVRRIIFATKRATSTFLLSELLEKRAYGETWSLIHDGENVAFTAVEKMMDISSILTRLQTK